MGICSNTWPRGLDRAGNQFLWSLREPPPRGNGKLGLQSLHEIFAEALFEGFLQRAGHIGKIPTNGYPSPLGFGGFCVALRVKLNSTLEQQLNTFVLVKGLGLGVRLEWITKGIGRHDKGILLLWQMR
uniref:Uncharacterized protein n=1 Tax=Opuntia streptacantha TaxID=393608 RepID=A0A7C9DDW0_OPUST